MAGTLYIVSTPIGNKDDITIRALKILREVDFIVCEEFKAARRLLSDYEIEKELYSVNEHNEKENSPEIINLIHNGKNAALISDCGTPLFSDPGHYLLDLAISYKIKIVIIPGVNSLIPAITGSNLHIEKFYFYGWLSPKKDERRKEYLSLKRINDIIVLMETPYRLQKMLEEVESFFGKFQPVVLAYRLTEKDENIYRGPVHEISEIVKKRKMKGEFVLIIDNRTRHG
ncbi:MAG: 16S rRNA (cytidine(1402)-2'-O)-methyltransferase [Melioribacteraceae bacterium]|nr:16S rRNA (cytidine(1402)-2'-O)-methyltransferase [Melioribacteraceae bacterium]